MESSEAKARPGSILISFNVEAEYREPQSQPRSLFTVKFLTGKIKKRGWGISGVYGVLSEWPNVLIITCHGKMAAYGSPVESEPEALPRDVMSLLLMRAECQGNQTTVLSTVILIISSNEKNAASSLQLMKLSKKKL